MALQLIVPEASFVRFGEGSGVLEDCNFTNIRRCLPVLLEDDVKFQFFITGLAEEIDALCGPYGTPIQVGIVNDCDDPEFLVEFPQEPDIFKLSDTQLLVYWGYGLPDFTTEIDPGECFRLRVQIGLEKFCSNCFERIDENCYTSVVEYYNEENAFGFNYCAGALEGEDSNGSGGSEVCRSTVIPFNNQTNLSIPYTTELQDLYGNAPTVQVWIYIGAELQNVLIQQTWDSYPPNTLDFDFGGLSSGVIVIK